MSKRAFFVLVLCQLLVLAGCATVDEGPAGEGGGAAAPVDPTGVSIGGTLYKYMDKSDRRKLAQALSAERIGFSRCWNNPRTGHVYTVLIDSMFESNDRDCREYTIRANIAGRPESIEGKVCRDGDGDWEAQT